MKQTLLAFTDDNMLKLITAQKSMTRRLIVPQPIDRGNGWFEWGWKYGARRNTSPRTAFWNAAAWNAAQDTAPIDDCSPYGQVSDEILCRENLVRYVHKYAGNGDDAIAYRCNGAVVPMSNWAWKNDVLPSRFMPRGLARYAFPIAELRAERLQDITEADVIREGVTADEISNRSSPAQYIEWSAPIATYAALWDSINGKRAPWVSNPWVWTIGWSEADVRRL